MIHTAGEVKLGILPVCAYSIFKQATYKIIAFLTERDWRWSHTARSWWQWTHICMTIFIHNNCKHIYNTYHLNRTVNLTQYDLCLDRHELSQGTQHNVSQLSTEAVVTLDNSVWLEFQIFYYLEWHKDTATHTT